VRIVYKSGSFLDGPEPVSCHGCNAQGRMGGTVATQVRERFPPAFAAYLATHAARGLRLGEVVFAACAGRAIANAVTQRYYGNSAKTGEVYVDYDAVAAAVAVLDRVAAQGKRDGAGNAIPPFASVAFPLIGAGLAGGDWRRIASILEDGSRNFSPVVYTRDGRPPA
jgi:O-acetyl-ADP-ribose deacetylase (regulator of RNase III)